MYTQIWNLGILIDEHLNWSKHVSQAQSLIAKTIIVGNTGYQTDPWVILF